MAQNITIAGETFSDVPGLEVPKTGGGTAFFPDVSSTTATAPDVASGKVFYLADGTQATGSASGGGGGAISIVDTPDAAGGTIRTITAVDISGDTVSAAALLDSYTAHDATGSAITGSIATKTSADLTVSGDTVITPAGYYASSASASVSAMTLPTDASPSPSGTSYATINAALAQRYLNIPVGYNDTARVYNLGAMPPGTAGTPTATKGTVSNHSVSVTPSVTNTTGYISGSTKTGTAVTVSASELVSGSQTITNNGTVDVTNLAEVVVSVSGGSGKAIQANTNMYNFAKSSYTATDLTLTVAKAGTYTISWMACRGSSSGTMGTRLRIGSTDQAANQTWERTYMQHNKLTGQSLTANTVLTVYANSGSTTRYIGVGQLVIEEE